MEQVATENEVSPTPTPKEDQGEPVEKDSSSKPRSQRINYLLRQVDELGVLERDKNN